VETDGVLWQFNEVALLLAFLAGFLGATEVGFRLGMRYVDQGDDSAKAHVSSLHAAVLGVLALLLGFTFLMAVSRFDARKSLVIEEANAIGTTFLRAHLLPPEQQRPAKELLRAHLSARLAFYAAGIDPARLERAHSEAGRIERQLWALAVDAAAQDPRSVRTGLFVESLNAVIDLHEKSQVALENHVPEAVLYLLLVVSVVSFVLLGYGCGLTQRRRAALNVVFALLISFVLTAILDIDRPRRGLITVSQESLIRLQATLERDAK
jgi:hypothetical protein